MSIPRSIPHSKLTFSRSHCCRTIHISETTTLDHEIPHKPDPKSIEELRHARDALDRKFAISLRLKASTLKEINLDSPNEAWTLKIAKELACEERSTLIGLLSDYQDVFTWSYNDMKGLDPQYYQHQIHL